MTKTLFQSKPTLISAERFYPEKKPWPDGVIDLSNEVVQQGWGIDVGASFAVVNPGDWVVTGMLGERIVLWDRTFRESFDWIKRTDFFSRYSDGQFHWDVSGLSSPRRLPDWDSFIFLPQRFERYGVDFALVSLYIVTMTYEAGVANAGRPHVCASCGLVDTEKFHRNVRDCLDAALKRIKELEGEKIPEGAA